MPCLSAWQVPVIYLVHASPHGSSIPPSIVLRSDGPPSDDGIHELAASRGHSTAIARRLVVSYTTFSPLPRRERGGYFLLPSPTVTHSFYFRKWSALCCPDFPLALQKEGQRQAVPLHSECKITSFADKRARQKTKKTKKDHHNSY